MTKELMQYDPERDDKVVRLTFDGLLDHPIARHLFGTDKYADVDYVMALKRAGQTDAVVSRTPDYSKIGDIKLYNALRGMELSNPSVSRIREELVTCSNIAERLGTVTGRDFETNQPVFYEDKILQANPEARACLDRKLGEEIREPGNSPVLRATWFGTPDIYDGIDTSAGRLVGVTRQ